MKFMKLVSRDTAMYSEAVKDSCTRNFCFRSSTVQNYYIALKYHYTVTRLPDIAVIKAFSSVVI